ncbi:hypothetical protein Poly51_18140 [Rubripirellula tenax]|uniref:Uncharacterized protein n=1 Tax=Rubripirellula tenax TaxID=2528015 RepID=A0A5C6FHD0_9BACT|nr:hypothetical protein [Rubripirellula tenax]TWU59029.1 hypothetical protein Poly51_18140 [Rubripirellula tenax]
MFLLPVILWWAKEPMRFAVGRYKRFISAVIMVAIAMTVSHRSIADDRTGRGAEGDAARALTSEQAGRKSDSNAVVIREGTMIPATQGRVVMLGRRWAFVPDRAQDGDVASDQDVAQGMRSTRSGSYGRSFAKLKTRPNVESPNVRNLPASNSSSSSSSSAGQRDWQRGGASTVSETPRQMFGTITFAAMRDDGVDATSETAGGFVPLNPSQFVLVENLSLQRIVEAIRDDASDDRWILSGEVTEFFGENRLSVRTAQRSNSN